MSRYRGGAGSMARARASECVEVSVAVTISNMFWCRSGDSNRHDSCPPRALAHVRFTLMRLKASQLRISQLEGWSIL
jgi:hypothetical protein